MARDITCRAVIGDHMAVPPETCSAPRSPGSSWCAGHRALYSVPPTPEQIARSTRDALYSDGRARLRLRDGGHALGSDLTNTVVRAEGAGNTGLTEITPERATAGDNGAVRRSNRIADE